MNHGVVFTEPCKVAMQEVEMPKPGPKEMLVRSTKTLISTGTELTWLMQEYPEGSRWSQNRDAQFPSWRQGYSNVGEVVEVGPEVEGWEVGDRVASGLYHHSYVVVHPKLAVRIPDNVSDEIATMWMLGRIATNGVRRGQLHMGECVVVFGLGIIGQIAAQMARIDGARPVIGVDISPMRREFAEIGGANLTIDGSAEDLVDQVSAATRGRMADCVFEITGLGRLIPREMDTLHGLGRIVILSSPREKTEFDFHDYCNGPSFTIIGAHNGSHPQVATPYNPWTPERNTELLFDLIGAGDVKLDHLITNRYPWQDAPEGYDLLMADRGQAGAVIIDWTT